MSRSIEVASLDAIGSLSTPLTKPLALKDEAVIGANHPCTGYAHEDEPLASHTLGQLQTASFQRKVLGLESKSQDGLTALATQELIVVGPSIGEVPDGFVLEAESDELPHGVVNNRAHRRSNVIQAYAQVAHPIAQSAAEARDLWRG